MCIILIKSSVFITVSFWLIFAANARAEELPAAAYIQHIAIDYSNPDILYAATADTGLFRSFNAAARWEKINPTPKCSQYYVIEIDPVNPARIYAGGNESGIWVSPDRGNSWRCAGLEGMSIADMAIDPAAPSRIFVLAENGVYRNTNIENAPWQLVFDYLQFQQGIIVKNALNSPWRYSRFQKIAVNPHDPAVVYIGARWEGGYHLSTDGGDTWRHEWISGIFRRADPIVFHPRDPNIVFLGTHHQGMFKSYNRGRSWVTMSRGLGPQIRTPFYGAYLVCGLALDPSNPDILFTGSDYANWKTIDGGRTWTEVGKTLTCEFARTFAVDPLQSSVVYAGSNIGIYKSTDGGATWQSANIGLPELAIKQTFDFTIEGEKFRYALTDGIPPVFRKSLSGNSNWMSVSWMLYETVNALRYEKSKGELILNTGQRTYRSNDGGLRWDVPMISYAPVRSLSIAEPASDNPHTSKMWTLKVDIRGDVFFEDMAVDSLYQRPPYVSLQLVSSGYPCDGSIPIWTENWQRYLQGKLQIPRTEIEEKQDYILYIEIRDFQKNVRVGYAAVDPQKDDSVSVNVSPELCLPCLDF